MLTISEMDRILKEHGFDDIVVVDSKVQKLLGKKKQGEYEFTVQVEYSNIPKAIITGKNGCSMKYITENLDAVVKVVDALDGKTKFCELWEMMR